MKIGSINSTEDKRNNIVLKGKRVFQNTVKQLSKNNKYSLTEPNQRLIRNAITELSKVKGSKNIEFLMNTATQSTYSTNIELQDKPKNNWKELLLGAASAAAALTAGVMQNEFVQKIANLGKKSPLTDDEKQIMNLRDELLSKVDLEQIKADTKGTMKDFKKNLDYFIVSSETTIEHKKYVLEKLNFFMSDDYEINPQLEDKKHIALAEMVNDMAIDVPGNKIPNIKAVDQRSHGVCAAISIARKKLVYEDKPNYIDCILSELDSSNQIMVYDRSKLGSGEKVPVEKVDLDFNAALNDGYRIIDASSMYWMHIANMSGTSNISYFNYKPFDKENFNIFNDTFGFAKFEDENLSKAQEHFQALNKAQSVIKDYKETRESYKNYSTRRQHSSGERTKTESRILELLKEKVAALKPELTSEQVREIVLGMFSLEQDSSDKITPEKKFLFLENEEDSVKLKKFEDYLRNKTGLEDIDDNTIAEIYDSVTYYNQLESNTLGDGKKLYLRKAKDLLNVGATFRHAIVKGLENKNSLEGMMRAEGLPNKETLATNTIDRAINLLENNSPHSNLIIQQLSPLFSDTEILEKEDLIEALAALKDVINQMLNEGLDEIYSAITLGSKKTALMMVIDNFYNAIDAPNNKKTIELIADIFEVRATEKSVRNELQKAAEKISQEGDEGYLEIFHKIGAVSQMEYVGDLFSKFVEKITEQPTNEQELMEYSELITAFFEVNGITDYEDETALPTRLKEIEKSINSIYSFIQTCAENLKVVDENNEIILSANPKDIIIKRLENRKQLPAKRDLLMLQEHIDAVNNDRRNNNNRRGALSDESLYNFTKAEKDFIKHLDKSISPMLAYTQKQIDIIKHSDFYKQIQELGLIIGKNSGNSFVKDLKVGGLDRANNVRVLEYMTGRPHHFTYDREKAIETIKKTPYSGINLSHVDHTDISGHAQYIADIEPVKVKITDENGEEKIVDKEILWHDNTWGAAEKENTWVDSQGFTRTDYDNYRGGTLGYLTNDKYRNGNFVDRILNEMTVARHKIPQYLIFTLDGKSINATLAAHSIYETIYDKNNTTLKDLTKVASKLSTEELNAKIKKADEMEAHWYDEYQRLNNRIFSTKFSEGINSKEDYDKLADNDTLKVTLEKIATAMNGQFYGFEKDFYAVNNVKDLEKFKKTERIRAINDFKYAFGKSSSIIEYLGEKFDLKESEKIEKLLKDKYNIELTEEESAEIGKGFGLPNNWDGSIKSAIDLMMKDLSADVDNVIKHPEANKAVKDYLRNFLEENLYFNEKDIEKAGIKHLIDFIDRVFDPEDDTELVQTYRRIQDMTKDEFKKEVLSKATVKDLGMKTLTGYDILKKLKVYDTAATKQFRIMIINSSLKGEINFDENNLKYGFTKFDRVPIVTPKNITRYDFDNLYNQTLVDLMVLNNEKVFNAYKDINEKDGYFAAYSKFDYVTKERIKATFDPTTELIERNVVTITQIKNQIETYDIGHKFEKYASKFNPESVPSDYQYKRLNLLAGNLLTLNTAREDAQNAAKEILELPKNTAWKNYLPLVKIIIDDIKSIEHSAPTDLLGNEISRLINEIATNERIFSDAFIQKRHQNEFNITLNKYEQALIKQEYEKALELKTRLFTLFEEHHILKDTRELVQSYLKSCTKDSETKELHDYFKAHLNVATTYAKLGEIENIIMKALENGAELSVRSSLKGYELKTRDGREITLDSPEMVADMAHRLIADNKLDTPLMFLEKLGLGEIYVDYMNKSIDFDKLKKIITQNYNLAVNFSNFEKSANILIDNATTALANGENYLNILNNLKADLTNLGKKCKLTKKENTILPSAIDQVLEICTEDSSLQKDIVFNTLISSAKSQIASLIQAKYEKREEQLSGTELLMTLVTSVMLLEDSPVHKKRAEICEKYRELAEYREQLSANLQEE